MERISLSNSSFEGNNNAYLFDGPETVLVDTGDWLAATRDKFRSALADYGVSFADVDRVLLTHWHRDHSGLAGEIQAESGATVHVNRADAPLVARDTDAVSDLEATHERVFEAWAVPVPDRAVLREILIDDDLETAAPEVTPFQDGDTFTIGDRELRVVHAPGHTAGQSVFELDGGEALTGDALLPVYTPNVGGADVRVDRALAKYLDTLDAIAAADYDRAWPGHRDPIDDPVARADTIRHHHEERAYRVLDALRRLGPCNIWTVSADLFGDLESIHILHGPGECAAHLDHLERAGAVVREGDTYRLAAGVGDELDRREDERWPLVD